MFAFRGPLFIRSDLATEVIASFCPTSRREIRSSMSRNRSPTSRRRMSGGFFVSVAITSSTSFPVTVFPAPPRISTRTHAVSSQLITLSGRRRERAYRSDMERAKSIASSRISTP
jgi:hypothetical protein